MTAATTIRKIAIPGLLALGMAAPLAADKIFFFDKDPIEKGNVVVDTMRRIEWKGQVTGNAKPWEVERFVLERNRGKDTVAYEEALSKAIQAGQRAEIQSSNPLPIIEQLTTALAIKAPTGYSDAVPAELRIRYYLVWATLAAGRDPTEAFKAYTDANVAAAKAHEKAKAVTPTNRKVADGAYKDIDFAYLHSFTIDSYKLIGRWHASQKDYEKAWTEGYGPAATMAESSRTAFNEDEWATRYAIPLLREAADNFIKSSSPDYKRGAEVYARMSTLAQAIKDDGTFNWARLMGARCSLNQGDATAAERVYNSVLKPLEDSKKATTPTDRRFDWITPAKATSYAQALNGRGLIAAKAGKDMEALKHFTEALGFFSADREARAEALYEAAMANVRMAKKTTTRKEYYRKTAEAYHLELSLTLLDTESGKREGALKDAIRAIGKN